MSTREFVGNGMIELRNNGISEAGIIRYVRKKLPIGKDFFATRNFWSQDNRESAEEVRRIVLEHYDHHLVTIDDLGRTESFTYFDLYHFLKNRRKKNVQATGNMGSASEGSA